jgi:hypothetical protein
MTVAKEISKYNNYVFTNVTIDGVCIGQYTPLGTTSIYRAIANLHTTITTTAPATPFPAYCVFNSRSLATVSNSGDSSAFRAHVVTVRRISRNCTHSADLGSSLYSYSLRVDPEKNASNNPSTVMGGCLAIAWISCPRERVYRAVTQKQPFVYPPIA